MNFQRGLEVHQHSGCQNNNLKKDQEMVHGQSEMA